MKKLVFMALLFMPSLVLADRLGSLKSSSDLLLTTQAVNGTPAGSGTEIQYNTGGSFDSSPNLTFDGTSLLAPQLDVSNGQIYRLGALIFNYMSSDNNLFIGPNAGNLLLSGASHSNTAVGIGALLSIIDTSLHNSAFGRSSLLANTTGSKNSAFGRSGLIANDTGANNTSLGYLAGGTNVAGSSNTLVGANADVASAGLVNATALGADAVVSSSDSIMMGKAGTTVRTHSITWDDGTIQVSSPAAGAAGSGDITDVVAGTNMNGGATSGSATLNLNTAISISSITVSSATNLAGQVNISSYAIITATGSLPALKIIANGTYGVSAGTSGGLFMDFTGGGGFSGMGAQFYTNASTQAALGGIINVIQALAGNTWNEPGAYIKMASTNGGAANVRLDGPAPQIEFVENDQTTPAGKYEIGVNGDKFYVAGRSGADSGFTSFVNFVRPDASSGNYAALLGTCTFRLYDGDSSNFVGFISSVSVGSNVTWTLPAAAGSANQVWATDGSNNLFFLTVATAVAAPLTLTNGVAGVDNSSVTLQGNTFNSGSQLLQLSGGLVPNANVDGSSITKQGNTFNGINQLLQLNSSSLVPDAQINKSSVTAGGVLIGGNGITSTPASGSTTISANSSVLIFSTAVLQSGSTIYVSSETVDKGLTLNYSTSGYYAKFSGHDLIGVVSIAAADIAAGTLGGSVIASSVGINTVGLSQLSATGTKDATTFFRGDNTWATPAGSGDMVLASTQTSTGAKTFQSYTNFTGTASFTALPVSFGGTSLVVQSTYVQIGSVDVLTSTNAETMTNKTFDATAAGNILSLKGHDQWNNADFIITATNTWLTSPSTAPMYGRCSFAQAVATNTNGGYAQWFAPPDIDTNTEFTAYWTDISSGIDISSRSYIATYSSAPAGFVLSTPTLSLPITIAIPNANTGAIGKIGTSAATTLTGWAANFVPGTWYVVSIARQGDSATLDGSNVISYWGGLDLWYKKKQKAGQ